MVISLEVDIKTLLPFDLLFVIPQVLKTECLHKHQNIVCIVLKPRSQKGVTTNYAFIPV